MSNENVFTNEDLRQLKNQMNDPNIEQGWFDLPALLARLEAAEAAIVSLAETHNYCSDGDCAEVLEVWRRAKGESE